MHVGVTAIVKIGENWFFFRGKMVSFVLPIFCRDPFWTLEIVDIERSDPQRCRKYPAFPSAEDYRDILSIYIKRLVFIKKLYLGGPALYFIAHNATVREPA